MILEPTSLQKVLTVLENPLLKRTSAPVNAFVAWSFLHNSSRWCVSSILRLNSETSIKSLDNTSLSAVKEDSVAFSIKP